MILTDMRVMEFMALQKKGYDKALYSVNKRHDFSGIHDINRNFPYDNIFQEIMHDIQSCMTLTDMRLTEFMGLTEKSAMTKLFI